MSDAGQERNLDPWPEVPVTESDKELTMNTPSTQRPKESRSRRIRRMAVAAPAAALAASLATVGIAEAQPAPSVHNPPAAHVEAPSYAASSVPQWTNPKAQPKPSAPSVDVPLAPHAEAPSYSAGR